MYFLVFLLQLINLYVVFNVTLKSATWFTTNIQVPTLNYLNSFANIPTKYFLLPHLHIETDESEESDDSYDSSPEDSSDVNRTDISTESDSTESDSTETASDCETSESESDHKIPDDDNSSDSDDEVKHLPVKPSVIIMDEKLD